MNLIRDLKQLPAGPGPIVAAAGFFDGLHLGHQKVIAQVVRRARRIGGRPWVLTFDPHPLRVLNPAAAPPLLTSVRHKLMLLDRLGLDGCILLPFDRNLAATEPEAFAAHLLDGSPPLAELFAGRNWRFGRNGRGTSALLRRMSAPDGLRVHAAVPEAWREAPISSTRIRSAVQAGRLADATAMLGRPFSLLGSVTSGAGIGRTLGFPTANLHPQNEALPPLGVYAALALLIDPAPAIPRAVDRAYLSVVNFGVRPTLYAADRQSPVIEAHLLDLERDLSGLDVELFLVARLRDEQRFPSRAALAARIAQDVADTRALCAGMRCEKKWQSIALLPPLPSCIFSPRTNKATGKERSKRG